MPTKKKTSKNTQNKSGTRDEDVEAYMKIFSFAYNKSASDYTRLKSLQRSYDNTILDTAWPTTSRIPIATFYDMVEKALPVAMDGLFSPSNRVKLMPMEAGVTMEQVRKSESALWNLVSYRMKVKRNATAILKDCFKCSVGFGIVEPFYVTPASSSELRVSSEAAARSTRVMQVGAPRKTLRLRYINPGQIVVMLDGSDFNGNDPVSISFLYDIYSEGQFRGMYDKQVADGEKPEMLGNLEAIIEEARSTGFTSDTDIDNLVKSMAGKSIQSTKSDDEFVPVHIPVLKVYDKNKHVWIANGTTRIYEQSDEYQTMRCPLVKASAWLDGNRFYPMSTPEAYQRIGWAKNIVVNLFLDMLTMGFRRPLVYNAEYFDREPSFGPDDKIKTNAPDARIGAAYLESVKIDPAAMTLYDMINLTGASLTGQKDFMDKNYTRGGSMAFQDLLATTEGIDRMKSSILEMTFLESVFNQALIYLQVNIGKEGETVRTREKKKLPGGKTEESIQDLTVTEQDLCHAYELSLDLDTKLRKGAMEKTVALQAYDRKSKSPFFDQWEVAADHLCDSDEEVRRQMKSREEVARIQAEQERLAKQEQASRVISNLQGGGGGGAGGGEEAGVAEAGMAELTGQEAQPTEAP